VVAALLAVGVVALTTARLFVVPQTDVPQGADAVVALEGDDAHVTRALELMNQQVAPVLILSGGEDPARALPYRLCTQPQPFEVLCPPVAADGSSDPTASSTLRAQAQAQALGRIATERGWNQMALVGLPEQLSRARLLVERCTTAEVAPVMVETPVSQRLEHLGGEAAGYLRALFLDRSC
jgi:hypothetical protein